MLALPPHGFSAADLRRSWAHCPRVSHGSLPHRIGLLGSCRWNRRSDGANWTPPFRSSDNHSYGFTGHTETPRVLGSLTSRVRARPRVALWRQWKTTRRRRALLLALGVRPKLASHAACSRTQPL